ncbi:3'-5'-exoribonuclease [Vanrija albida]|uniref:3'-5'-exoribonuclease n=1 Tax=Vanrija albida TaxID=181172 RepID=A0ABR3QFL9_9TREE
MATTFDRRRIPAPEDSHPPIYENVASSSSKQADAGSVYLKTGLVTQANGSAYIEANGVKIACSAFGPRPKPPPYSPQGSLNVEVKFAPFASRSRRAPLRDTEPVNHSVLLTQLLLPSLRLHLLPKLSIDVHLLVLEGDSDAAVLSAGLTACSAAIADAGIPMSGLTVGSSVASLEDTLLLNPTAGDLSSAQATVTVGAMPALGRITSFHLVGETDLDEACKMVELGVTGAKTTHTILAQALVEGSSA